MLPKRKNIKIFIRALVCVDRFADLIVCGKSFVLRNLIFLKIDLLKPATRRLAVHRVHINFWRIFLATAVIVSLTTGINPWNFLVNSLEAINGSTRIIKLYSSACGVNPAPLSQNSGWWNAPNASSRPDLRPDASSQEFSAENSAFYTGGEYNLECGDFQMPFELEKNDEIASSEAPGKFVPIEGGDISPISIIPSSDTIELESDDPGDIVDQYEAGDNQAGTGDNIENLSQASSSIDNSQIDQVEIVEPEEKDSPVEIIDQTISLIKSWGIKIRQEGMNLFDHIAYAEDDKNATVEDLGTMESAQIGFSLAFLEKKINEAVLISPSAEAILSPGSDLSVSATSSQDNAAVENRQQSDVVNQDNYNDAAAQTGEEPVSSEANSETGSESGIQSASSTSLNLNDIFQVPSVQADDSVTQPNDRMIIWYSLDNTATNSEDVIWHKLDSFSYENYNASHGGYFLYDAPFLSHWDEVKQLKIKLQGLSGSGQEFEAYLDSVWVEAKYIRQETEEERLHTRKEEWKRMLKMLSWKKDFTVNEVPGMDFHFEKRQRGVLEMITDKMGWSSYWDNVYIDAKIQDNQGKILDIPVRLELDSAGDFSVVLAERPRRFSPGKYHILFQIIDNSTGQPENIDIDQEFTWGEIAINVSKSIYAPGETAYFSMATLDDMGHTLCNSELDLYITAPDGGVAHLSSANGLIIANPECGPDNVIDKPDYWAEYGLAGNGSYQMKMVFHSPYGDRVINDAFEVSDRVLLDVERNGPTRIYPKAAYEMSFKIKAKADYQGNFDEYVPLGFKILNYESKIIRNENGESDTPLELEFEVIDSEDNQQLSWKDLSLKSGDEIVLSYTFDAPDVSPAFYLLGPAQTSDFAEARSWQIASDALETRANSVQFPAGLFMGSGSITYGQASNATNSLPSFNFRLGESGVAVKNAFIVVEAQIEAYANNAGAYASSSLSFDSCQAPCTPNAVSGTNKVSKFDSTILAYDETESDMVRVIMDVTSQAQLAAYTGGSVPMSAQVAYRFNRTGVLNTIASVRATLHVTYTYNPEQTTTYTNTVFYPLESNATGDSGTRQASQADDCTLNTNCPTFAYKMEMPDFTSASSTRLAQWFTVYNQHYNNTTSGVNTNVNIQGTDINSYTHILEAANSGQGVMLPGIFDSVSGYAENTTQNLEVHATSAGAPVYYLMGGESTETYLASSSAPIKTRTVTFPLGVINNGSITASSTANANVYFPENGSATGTVKIKKAWVRMVSNAAVATAYYTDVVAKIGAKATTTRSRFNFRAETTTVKSSFNYNYRIATTTYDELEKANAATPINVLISTQSSNANVGSISGELVITYTYSDEGNGHLTNLSLFAGQSYSNPNNTSTPAAANLVFPESKGVKTLRGASLLSSFLLSATGGTMAAANSVTNFDANISTGGATCVNTPVARNMAQNTFFESYKNVTGNLNTTNNQAVNTCYTNGTVGSAVTVAKQNGILNYTYQWDNRAPTSTIATSTQRMDGSGWASIKMQAGDPDYQDLRAKVEYAANASCDFSSSFKPTLDTSISADYGTPVIDNGHDYQIGTSSGMILTSSGSNNVNFAWKMLDDVGTGVDATYCLRLTANDIYLNQATSATSTILVDTKAPTAPGALSLNSRTGSTLVLNFGAASTESHFKEYKVFYKPYDGGPVSETDSVLSSSTDANLGNILFNNEATTTLTGLTASMTYSIALYAYDWYGNKASSSRVEIMTNDAPTGVFRPTSQKDDGSGAVRVSIQVDDVNHTTNARALLEYKAGSDCTGGGWTKTTLDENPSTISASYGAPRIDNAASYQVGIAGNWITTAVGANNVDFDWLSKSDIPAANGSYCLRLTANDSFDDQSVLGTTTLTVDNVDPIPPGNLTDGGKTMNSITLVYGGMGDDDHFSHYEIFYKMGNSGATVNDTPHTDSNLNSRNYSGASDTTVGGLLADTQYVFNIWSYDLSGNASSAIEVVIKTNSSLTNDALTFVNPVSGNIAAGDDHSVWIFRAQVSDINGWQYIGSSTLRLADNSDNSSPFEDLVFRWDQNTNTFTETGSDALNAASLSNASSSCSSNSCILDFRLVFNKTFNAPSTNYSADIYSTNDAGKYDLDSYTNIYQVRTVKVRQLHYRWRNDNGKE